MSIIDHVSLGTNDFKTAVEFYDAVMAPLGYERVVTYEEYKAAGYGGKDGMTDLWIGGPFDRKAATPGNGTHICFVAPSQEAVNAFYRAAIKHGASDDGAPGPRPHYREDYYGAFVKDPDGNKIEAVTFSKPLK